MPDNESLQAVNMGIVADMTLKRQNPSCLGTESPVTREAVLR